MRYFIGNWKMFGVPKSIKILNKIILLNLTDLKKQLLKIRTQGYSLNHGEAYENTYGIGVAILDKDKRSFAGISLSGSRNIMNPKNTIDYVKLLQSASIKISKLIVDN